MRTEELNMNGYTPEHSEIEAFSSDSEANQRLERAFSTLERRIQLLQEQVDGTPDVEVLEQENKELHNALVSEQSQTAHLRDMVKALNKQLEEAAARIERLSELANGEQDAT